MVEGEGEGVETKPPAVMDNIKWLLENEDQRLLFLEVERARFIKGAVDLRMRQLIAHGLVKNYGDGIGLSEHGRRVLEGFEAIAFLDKIP